MSRLSKLDVIGLLQEHGAILNGHFELPSGFHSQTYVQTALVLQYPNLATQIARAMAEKFPGPIDTVVSPGGGAVVIGQEVARVKKCRAIFTERVQGQMTFKRDFQLRSGERVLIIEDVLTTGRSTSQVLKIAAGVSAKVVGVAGIVDRSTEDLPLNVPVRALISYPLHVFPQDHCPLCAQNIPISYPGGSPKAGKNGA